MKFVKKYVAAATVAASTTMFTLPQAGAVVIDAYLGWNYVDSAVFLDDPFVPTPFPVMALTGITYQGPSGAVTQPIPDFGGLGSGMPDGEGVANNPTYWTTIDGDGETTRTVSTALPIDWYEAGATTPWGTFSFPTIGITGISIFGVPGSLTSGSQYVVGLIPAGGVDTELSSTLGGEQSDIYDLTRTVSFSADPATMIDGSGNFIFSAAAVVPVPAAVWLFGSGLLGMIGIARRKKAA